MAHVSARLFVPGLFLAVSGCADLAPDGPTLDGTSPQQDATLEPGTTVAPK